jgi:hypothetical protein
MGPPAFLPGEGAGDNGFAYIEKGLKFEGLHEIRIKHPPFVLHHDRGGTMDQRSECRGRTSHGFVSSNETKIEAHQLAEFLPNLPGTDRPPLCQQALDASLFGCELVCHDGLPCDGTSVLSGSNSRAPAEYNRLKE